MRKIIYKKSDLKDNCLWLKYQKGLRELTLLEAPKTIIYAYKCATARVCFLSFVDVMTKGELSVAPFHQILGAAFEDLKNLRYRRLIASIAPRSGKSFLSQHFIAWLYGHDSNISNIIGSYSKELSGTFERGIRNILKKPEFKDVFPEFPGFRVGETTKFKGDGALIATSPGSSLTGFTSGSIKKVSKAPGAMVIDDPLKSAESVAKIKQLKPWWGQEASTRKTNNWIQAIIGTRWIIGDLHQIVLDSDGYWNPESNPLGWRYINFESICRTPDEDLLERKRDETHWPNNPIFTLESLLAQEKTMGKNAFSALYQGKPVAEDGSIVKPHQLIFIDEKDVPHQGYIYFSLDCGLSEKQTADETSITVLKSFEKNVYVLDQISGRWLFTDLIKNVKNLITQYNPKNIVIERAAGGIPLIHTLKLETKIEILPKDGYTPRGSKQIRLQRVLPMFENSKVFLVKGSWNQELKNQLINFPLYMHDDRLDSLVWGLQFHLDYLENNNVMDTAMSLFKYSQNNRNKQLELKTSREDATWADKNVWGITRSKTKRNVGYKYL